MADAIPTDQQLAALTSGATSSAQRAASAPTKDDFAKALQSLTPKEPPPEKLTSAQKLAAMVPEADKPPFTENPPMGTVEEKPTTKQNRQPKQEPVSKLPQDMQVGMLDDMHDAVAKLKNKKRRASLKAQEEAASPAAAADETKPETITVPDGEPTVNQFSDEKPAAQEPKPDSKEDAPAPVEATPVAAEDPAKDGEPEVTMDEVEREIENKNLSKRHQKRMQFLYAQAKRAQELEAKVKDIEAKGAGDPEEVKTLRQRTEELEKEAAKYRRLVDAREDPTVKQYDTIAAEADKAILGKLTELGISQPTIDLITKMGGFEAFAQSSQTLPMARKDPDTGEVETVEVPASQVAKRWLEAMSLTDAKFIESKLVERFQSRDAKKRELDKIAAEAQSYYKNLEEQTAAQRKQAEEANQKIISEYSAVKQKWLESQSWLKPTEIPASATPEQRKEIETWNKQKELVPKLWDAAVSPKSVGEFADLVSRAASSVHLAKENSRLASELKAVQAQLDKVRSGSGTTPKNGSFSIASAPKKDKSPDALMKKTALEAMNEEAERLLRGGRRDDE